MRLVQASDALRLTGLSENQLREWCGRRGILQPAIPARGSGRPVLYSWQDIVALRVLLEIFTAFGAKASGWADGINELRCLLATHSFPSLWDKAAVFLDCTSASIAEAASISHSVPALVVPLKPHLVAVSRNSLGEENRQGQLPLISGLGSMQ